MCVRVGRDEQVCKRLQEHFSETKLGQLHEFMSMIDNLFPSLFSHDMLFSDTIKQRKN